MGTAIPLQVESFTVTAYIFNPESKEPGFQEKHPRIESVYIPLYVTVGSVEVKNAELLSVTTNTAAVSVEVQL